jgi:5-deoxy-glucuronate isomerase
MQWFYKKGELASANWDVVVDSTTPGWKHTGTKVGTLSPTTSFHIEKDQVERMIFPLEGPGITVQYTEANNEEQTQFLRGRKSVFHGPADNLYLPINTEIKITGEGRFLVAEAPAKNSYPVKFIAKEDVPVLLRGKGRATRQVHNFGVPEHLDADRMIVVEVIVPEGNWSGIPPHKHDTYIPGQESNLEEIYYFESALHRNFQTNKPTDPIGYIRGYASDERKFNELHEVQSGDVCLVPYGFHGPAMAAPGYDLYFMNVMAGPDPDRSWNIVDDPNHSWIRDTWDQGESDPRLPFLAD